MNQPYFEDDGIVLYHGSCLEIDAWLQADVLVTDPPYGMSFRSGMRKATEKFDKIQGDDTPELRDNMLQMWRGAKGTDAIGAVFGTWRVPRPPDCTNVLVWYKFGAGPGMGNLAEVFGNSHEDIYILGSWKKPPKVTRRGSVIQTNESRSAEAEKVGHPTPKPVGLMEQLIEATVPGTVIAEPFAGGGSTLVAARNLGRKAIGVEIEEKYCEIIANRLSQGALDFGELA